MAALETRISRLPVAIRRITDIDRSGRWLAAGWRDFLAAPGISLTYGAAFVILGNLLTLGLWLAGLDSLILPLAGGFIILTPLSVVGLYDVSRRLEAGQPVTFADVFSAFRANLSQLSAMGVVLLIAFLVWIEVALFLFMLFFSDSPPPLDSFVGDVLFSLRGAPLLLVGTLVGALFAGIVFSVTAVSVPLIYDRPLDVVTAISISLLCVQVNFRVMFGWAGLIAVLTAIGLATSFLGLLVAMPVLAFATWHAYRDLIEPVAVIEEAAFPAAAI